MTTPDTTAKTTADSTTTTPASTPTVKSPSTPGPDQGLTTSQDTFANPDALVPDQQGVSVGADGVPRLTGVNTGDGWQPAPVEASDEEIAAAEERNKADEARLEAARAASAGDSQAALDAQDKLPKAANNPGLGGSQASA